MFRLLLIVILAGCSVSPRANSGIKGGAVGGAVGAGAGALVGAVIANGDIVASAGMGAVVGIPVGVMIALYLHDDKERQILEANNSIIRANHQRVLDGRQRLNDLRMSVNDRTWELQQGSSYGKQVFTQPTIGDYH